MVAFAALDDIVELLRSEVFVVELVGLCFGGEGATVTLTHDVFLSFSLFAAGEACRVRLRQGRIAVWWSNGEIDYAEARLVPYRWIGRQHQGELALCASVHLGIGKQVAFADPDQQVSLAGDEGGLTLLVRAFGGEGVVLGIVV